MAHTIPNEPTSPTTKQQHFSTYYDADIQTHVQALKGNGIISGCEVTEQGSPTMVYTVAAGIASLDGSEVTVAGGSATIPTADATNPRWDLISLNSSGSIVVTAGTAAADPDIPDLPANSIYLRSCYVDAGDTAAATEADLRDLSINPLDFNNLYNRPVNRFRAEEEGGEYALGTSYTTIGFDTQEESHDSDWYGFTLDGGEVEIKKAGKYKIHVHLDVDGATGVGMARLQRKTSSGGAYFTQGGGTYPLVADARTLYSPMTPVTTNTDGQFVRVQISETSGTLDLLYATLMIEQVEIT